MSNQQMRRRISVWMVFFGLMLTASSAQRTTSGEIRGHVVDTAGAIVPGASVFVRKNAPNETDVRLTTYTDAHGDFVVVLPEGGYDVLITSSGFAAAVDTVAVLSGKTTKRKWKLKALGCDIPTMNCDTFIR